MPIMNPQISRNGSSPAQMVQDRRKALTALKDAMDAMTALNPHGRDYVGKDHQYSLDRALHRERQLMLVKLHDDIMSEALDIHEAGNHL